MAEVFFTDKSVPPTEKAILAALGKAAPAWKALHERLRAEHPDVSETWSYYVDGGGWLLKATRKSKTVFWLSVRRGSFVVAFYFPARLAGALLKGGLSAGLARQIREARPSGKLLGVRVEFGPARGVADVLALIDLKADLK